MTQLVIVVVVGIFLTACGKKGPLEQLEESDYPHTYPKLTN